VERISVVGGDEDGWALRARQAKHRDENEIEFSRIVAFSEGVFAIAITLPTASRLARRHA